MKVVFRSAPFRTAARAAARTSLRVLFLEDGGGGRARLAAAAFEAALKEAPCSDRPRIDAVPASIGAPIPGGPPLALVAASARSGLTLPLHDTVPLGDVVDCDLAIVCDAYDAEEARRDASVADVVDRGTLDGTTALGDGGGFYAARIRKLAPFGGREAAGSPHDDADPDDIGDPWLAQRTGAGDLDALVARVAASTAGLVAAINAVCARCAVAGTPPRVGLLTVCLCPLLSEDKRTGPSAPPPAAARTHPARTPTFWIEGDGDSADVYTVHRRRPTSTSSLPYMVRRARRAPQGYWTDPAAVDQALAELAPSPDRLPTSTDLLAANASSVLKAVQAHGGFAAAARRMGRATARRPNGVWKDFDSLASTLRQLAGPDRVMPSRTALKDSGMLALEHDIRRWGGSDAVAQAAGLKPRARQPSATGADLRAKLAVVAPVALKAGVLPGKAALAEVTAGADADVDALLKLVRRLGGFRAAADAAGLEYDREAAFLTRGPLPLPPPRRRVASRPPRSQRLEAAVAAASAFAASSPRPASMPTKAALLDAGRDDVARAVREAGGYAAVAAAAGLVWRDTRGGRGKRGKAID